MFSSATPVRIHANEVLFAAGDAGDGCYRIEDGLLKVTMVSRAGNERILAFLGPGAVVGELSIIDGRARSASAVAVRDSALSFLSRAAFEEFAQKHPEVYKSLVRLLATRLIAENEFVRSAIRQQKIIAIERLKDATAIALRKGDNSLTLGKARFMEAWLAYREIQSLIPQVRAKYRDQISPPLVDDFEIVPIDIKMLLEDPTEQEEEQALELAREEIKRRQRNDYEALEEAIPDLIRLERYERRAWSRQKRAIQQLVLIKFARAMAAARQVPTS